MRSLILTTLTGVLVKSQSNSRPHARSEEDNTDDGSAIGVNQPWSRTGQVSGSGSIIQGGKQNYANKNNAKGANAATSRLAHVSGDTDSGVDSPTYDGDVEMNSAAPSKYSAPTLSPTSTKSGGPPSVVGQDEVVASLHLLQGPTITTPSSPVSSLYPDPPSSAASTASLSDAENSSVAGQDIRGAQAPRRSNDNNSTPFIKPTVLVEPPSTTSVPQVNMASKATPKATDLALPGSSAPLDVATGDYENDRVDNDSLVNTSLLSSEDIRSFVQRAIEGEEDRQYKINKPPKGRPIRIYADGMSCHPPPHLTLSLNI